MNYNKIEELFVDFILDIIGPNLEREKDRSDNLKTVKEILQKIFESKLPDYTTYIYPYGSYPIKAYLNNADIDITIFFESKTEHKILIDLPIDLINEAIIIIRDGFERYNKENSRELFSDIKIIMADIRLLKCKINSISLDISINNFSGLYKILLIDYIENLFRSQFNNNNLFSESSYFDNKINIFRRTLLLIKGWCFYEGNLMGSNIGLMASYTLEILVIYIFNLHYEYIYNEFDGFEKFFEIMAKIDWEKNILSLFGLFSNLSFQKKLSLFNTSVQNSKERKDINEPFWYCSKDKNLYNKKDKEINSSLYKDYECEPLLKISELRKLISPINKSIGAIYLKKEGKIINSTNFDKLINILDPLNNHNNLGKSINFHSNVKMKKVIIYMNQQLKNIHKIRKKGNPFLYINSLLNLFKITLSKNFIELFINYINSPKIISNSKLFTKNKKNLAKKKIKIDIEQIQKFNALFTKEKINSNINYFDEEEYDNYEEENEEEERHWDPEGKDFETNYEEDEYAEEEEEEEEKKEKTINDDIKGIIDEKFIIKEEKIKFIPLINNQVIKKIFELYDNKQKIINDNNQLLKDSKDYSKQLEKKLKDYKLI